MCLRLKKPLNPNAEAWTPKQIAPPASPPPRTAIRVLPYPAATAIYPSYSVYQMSQPYYLPLTSSSAHIFFSSANGFCKKPTNPILDSGEKIHMLQKNSKSQNARKADGPMQKCPPLDGFKKGFRRSCPTRLRRPVRHVSVDKKPTKLGWRLRKLVEPVNETAVDGGAADLPQPRVSFPVPPLSAQGFSPSWNTTVMMRNIPNRLRRDDILKFLDGQCCAYSLEYDFLYLPMDFRKKGNLGYAFVNFTTATAANDFKKILHNFKWETVKIDSGSFISKKVCEITWARIQGKEVYTRRFENAEFDCDEVDFLPVVLDPPRNGSDPNPCPPLVLGNRQLNHRLLSKNY